VGICPRLILKSGGDSSALIADGASSGKRPRRASARLVVAAEAALPPLLRALTGDPLRAVLKLVGDADRRCARLVCRAFRDHSSPALKKCRGDFLRTRALVAFAWARMPGFVTALPRMLTLAASVGCVGVLEELVDIRQCALTADACTAAAKGGNLDALAWLHSRGCPWGCDICYWAAIGGHLEVLRFAHEHGCPWDTHTCNWAAHGGHLEVLRYAHEHGCPWEVNTCHTAAAGGHLEVLRYAHEHGCPWEIETCSYAAAGGHLEVLRYTHEHGSPWNSYTCYIAAKGGHLEGLRYAHEHGCPWTSNTCRNAAAGGHLEVLRYAYEHGCPLELDDCLAAALLRGHAEVVEYLRAAQPAA
jgi:hypothetical protein